MFTRYPWHESVWKQILARINSGTLPHALLLTGGNGIGKREFAIQLGQLLLCESFHANPHGENPVPCGHCQACMLNKAMTHPDLRWVEPESEGKIIAIDQIRMLSEFMDLKSHYGLGQVAIIHPAEKMNKFAANSLLKTLEEPASNSLIILVTSQPSALLPTIRSRCQQIPFQQPLPDITLPWLRSHATTLDDAKIQSMLNLANGGPLIALDYLNSNTLELVEGILASFINLSMGKADPVNVAKIWAETDVSALIKWLIMWTSYMIRLKYGAQLPDSYSVGESSLKKLAAAVDLLALFRFLDNLTDVQRLLDSQANVQLLLEDLLIVWQQLNSKKPMQ
ncbi:DNA polymerase III subunit delta' [Kaarinaea lacus]